MREPSDFERRVYAMVSEVPAGRVTTYAELAAALDCGSAQAVGQALKRNPWAPEVPCHRVIRADLSLGGYSGETGGEKVAKKLRLLEREGVGFDSSGRLCSEELLHRWPRR